MRIRSLVRLSLIACIPALSANEPLTEFRLAKERPVLHSPLIKEASGLACSSRDKRYLWLINDSGAPPEIHLATTDGAYRGKVTLRKTSNVDWEDLASFSLDGIPYLIVADIGDNNAKRETCTLHVIKEPKLPATGKSLARIARTAWQIRFRYEGGPRDCESIAVDVPNRKILLLTKRDHPPELHELPLQTKGLKPVITTKRIGLTKTEAPGDIKIRFRNQPTGLDISRDNKLAAAITYYGVFLFPRKPQESWATAFSHQPVILAPHLLKQAESIAFSKDGNTIHALSEGTNTPLARYQRFLPTSQTTTP